MPDQITKTGETAEERIRRDFFGPAKPVEEIASIFTRVASIRESIRVEAGDDTSRLTELNIFVDKLVEASIAQRFDQLTALATRDPLTGLGHRGAFDERLSVEIERALRYGRHFTLLLLDLDRFKQINDNYGHPAGDQVLLEFSRQLRLSLRQSDEAFRIGGDEFSLICPETTTEECEKLFVRLRFKFATSYANGDSHQPDVSWGAACFPQDAKNAIELIKLADQRLYEAKRDRWSEGKTP